MDVTKEFDLFLTPDGDLERTATGDIKMTSGFDLLGQHIKNRLENVNPDWFYDPIGADLEDLLGMPNESATATQGEDMIRNALADLVSTQDLMVQAVPVDKVTQLFFVFINTSEDAPMGFQVSLVLGSHVEVRRLQ